MMPDDVHVPRMPEPIPGSCENALERWPGDVIVDFPSVAALVGRMRQAFFSGETELQPAFAAVELSASQAVSGGRVAVDVPFCRPCRGCGGWGELGDEPCAACRGVGHLVMTEPVQVVVPSGVRDGARFLLRLGTASAPLTAVELRVRVR